MSKGFLKLIKDESNNYFGNELRKIPDDELELKKAYYFTESGLKPSCDEAFFNNKFVIMVFYRNFQIYEWEGKGKHLVVKPINSQPIKNHWSVLQKIKNIVCGEEWTGIEIYPPKQNVVDEANLYHLWCFPEDFKLEFGLHLPGWFSS